MYKRQPYSMLRLYADDILVNRLLYLDADVVACDDIEPLYNMGISDFEIAGVILHILKIAVICHRKDFNILEIRV